MKARFVVECHSDSVLVQVLTKTRSSLIHHSNGKTDFLKLLRRHNNLTGLIDEDPHSSQPKILSSFTLIEVNRHNFEVREYRNYTLIILKPKLEDWILEAAKVRGIDLKEEFGLNNDPEKLHEIINLPAYSGRFKSLVEAFLSRQSEHIKTLRVYLIRENKI